MNVCMVVTFSVRMLLLLLLLLGLFFSFSFRNVNVSVFETKDLIARYYSVYSTVYTIHYSKFNVATLFATNGIM